MPPRKQKQTASIEIPSFPPPPTMAPTAREDDHIPKQSPAKQAMGITQAQKQALIDNLQLEITERARKLRAQYALQAQGLRTRLEMRVNRIPQALRKRNIQELIDEHTAKLQPKPAAPLPVETQVEPPKEEVRPSAARKSLKRSSEHFNTTDDKENIPGSHDLLNPKKRAKNDNTTANTKATRTVSRKGAPPSVLSPRSNNSRTYPQSPFKATSPEKPPPFVAKPSSPMKSLPAQRNSNFAKPNSRAPSRQTTKRPATARSAMPSSDDPRSEASSAGTTVVSKPGAKKTTAAKKPPVPKTQTAAAKRGTTAAGKKESLAPAAAAAAAGGRTLRKRG